MLLVKKCQFFGYLDLVKMYYQLYSQFKGSYLRTSGSMTRKYKKRKRSHSCSTEGSLHKKFCKLNTWLDSLSSTQLSGKSNSQYGDRIMPDTLCSS